jgi:Transposase DDE domain
MSRQPPLYSPKALRQWTDDLAAAFPQLSRPQVLGLATWSFGMVLARCCALTAVALFLAQYLAGRYHAVRQRLREFYQEAAAKKGRRRRDLDVTACFAPLLRWVLRDWDGDRLAVAVDASALGTRFVVLCVAVVYRGGALPVAWAVLPANVRGSWKRPWLRLLRRFRDALPGRWSVVVLADRGLYAKWLFAGIRRLGWHPLLRVNGGGMFRPKGWRHFVPMADLVPQPGRHWRGRGTAFSTAKARLRCTLLAVWGEGHDEPWLLLTDLAPPRGEASWYGWRGWVEQFFKDGKRGGWQWQRTRMTDPGRAERLWLAIAVATVWLMRVGSEDEGRPGGPLPAWPPEAEAEPGRPAGRRWRLVSVFARGWVVLLAALLRGGRLPEGRLRPEPWPGPPSEPDPVPQPHPEERVA